MRRRESRRRRAIGCPGLRATAWFAAAALSACGSGGGGEKGTSEPGPLLAKAIAYERWHTEIHEPGYGGTVTVVFETPPVEGESLPEVASYGSKGDSTIWTGSYLAAEALRYAVTKDREARESAIRSATALHHHYRATGKRGFIGRYVAPARPPFMESDCGAGDEDCHVLTSGPYAGSYWKGNTSRDQYTGWWFGMSLAYEMIDDEGLGDTIRQDMREVIDRLGQDSYAIIDVDGEITTKGPRLIPEMIQGYHAAAAVAIGEQAYWDLLDVVSRRFMWLEDNLEIHGPNRYFDYYGFNLSHEAYFTLIRYDPDQDRREFHRRNLRDNLWTFVAGTHNAFFDYVYLASMGIRDAAIEADDRLALAEFPMPPLREIWKELPPAKIDPFSVVMDWVGDTFGLNELFDFEPQTIEPRPVGDRCVHTFLWQSSPYELECDPGDGRLQVSGTDYLVAYWMGRHFGFIGPDE